MGQHNQFEPGWEVPSDGTYVETGEHPDSGNLLQPRVVRLKRGEVFPVTRNKNRKWTRRKGHHNG